MTSVKIESKSRNSLDGHLKERTIAWCELTWRRKLAHGGGGRRCSGAAGGVTPLLLGDLMGLRPGGLGQVAGALAGLGAGKPGRGGAHQKSQEQGQKKGDKSRQARLPGERPEAD